MEGMRSSIVIIILVFATLGLLLGMAESVRSNTSSIELLILTTDKMEYARGEGITFTATNNGDVRLVFSDSSLQLYLINLDTDERHEVISGQVFNYLEPGESEMISWNYQRDGELGPGSYVGRISTSASSGHILRAEVNFEISE